MYFAFIDLSKGKSSKAHGKMTKKGSSGSK